MDETTEKLYIETATSTLAKHSGEKPKGWLGPWISESHVTPDLLQVRHHTSAPNAGPGGRGRTACFYQYMPHTGLIPASLHCVRESHVHSC